MKGKQLNNWVNSYADYLHYIEQFKFDQKDILDDEISDERFMEMAENMNSFYEGHPTMWDWVKMPKFIWLYKRLVRASKELATVIDDRQFYWLTDEEGNNIRKIFIE